jgi:Skp family chaperone for outer membrane proteins
MVAKAKTNKKSRKLASNLDRAYAINSVVVRRVTMERVIITGVVLLISIVAAVILSVVNKDREEDGEVSTSPMASAMRLAFNLKNNKQKIQSERRVQEYKRSQKLMELPSGAFENERGNRVYSHAKAAASKMDEMVRKMEKEKELEKMDGLVTEIETHVEEVSKKQGCTSDDDCPFGTLCKATLGICVPDMGLDV